MQILGIKPITWETWRPLVPGDFPCMLCHDKMATQKMMFKLGAVIGTLVVCPGCATKEAAEVHELIKDRPKKGGNDAVLLYNKK